MKHRAIWIVTLVLTACAHGAPTETTDSSCEPREPHEEMPVECWPASRELSGAFGD